MSDCKVSTANARNAYAQFRDGKISLNELVNNWEYWFSITVTRPYDQIFELLMTNWTGRRMNYAICIECVYGDQEELCLSIFEKEGLFR